MTLHPFDWYWLADDGRVYASARQAVVDKTDAGFLAFVAAGNVATPWPPNAAGAQTMRSLQEVLTPYGLYADLSFYAAAVRFARETVGITVGNAPVATDRDSQANINGLWVAMQLNPSGTVQFKSAGGGFVGLIAGQIQAVASAVNAHVQACRAIEAQVDAAITAGAVTTRAEVDAAFAAVAA